MNATIGHSYKNVWTITECTAHNNVLVLCMETMCMCVCDKHIYTHEDLYLHVHV